jgi:peptidoglycan/LPS O-acetylase OafA/YrhL
MQAAAESDDSARPASRLWSALSRRTSGGRFIAEIDGLRFVAIAWVLLYHVRSLRGPDVAFPLHVVTASGHFGVELFFMVSGFVLALPFAKAHLNQAPAPSLKWYFARRLTRLEPPYLVALGSFFVLKQLVNGASGHELLPHLLASSLYSHNLAYGYESTISIVTWSLEVEVQFYILAPLLGRLFAIRSVVSRRAALTVAASCASVCAAFVNPEEAPRYFLSLSGFIQFFLFGFLLADVYLVDWAGRSPRTSALWDAVGLAAFAALCPLVFYAYADAPGRVVAPLLTFVFGVAAFKGRALAWLFTRPAIFTIGGMCYSIYLWHSLPLHAVEHGMNGLGLSGWPRIALETALGMLGVLALSTLVFVLIERPCMDKRWPQKLILALRGRPP